MSLINDALKRAQQAQHDNPPATPALEFRPVEANQSGGPHTKWLAFGLALVIVAILGLSGLLVWYMKHASRTPLQAAARAVDLPVTPAIVTAAAPPPVTVPSATPTNQSTSIPSVDNPELSNTNHVPANVEAVVPAPPPANKLQGIFFNPQSPSAVVNGKTVYLGDRVNGFRVMGISPVAVTLVSATATNVLSLSE